MLLPQLGWNSASEFRAPADDYHRDARFGSLPLQPPSSQIPPEVHRIAGPDSDPAARNPTFELRQPVAGETCVRQVRFRSTAISSGGSNRKSANMAKNNVIATRRPSDQLISNPDVAKTRKPRHSTVVVVQMT